MPLPTRRSAIAGLSASAVLLVSLATSEGWMGTAARPVPGDKCTEGFGTTEGVKCGDKITPPRALARMLIDVQKDEAGIKRCITVPLYQYEYDAYLDLAYNIGPGAFCRSTIVKRLQAGDYAGACKAILPFDKFHGKPLAGLTKRRRAEYRQCIGGAS